MSICVVLPTYNESENIDIILGELIKYQDINILVVDDSSPDGTGAKVQSWVEEYPLQIKLYTRTTKEGLSRAYLDGFGLVLNKDHGAIVQMDADMSHDPKVLMDLVNPVLNSKADLVIGSRYIPGGSIPQWTWLRRWLSKTGNRYAKFVLQLNINDLTSGYRCFSPILLEKLIDLEVKADGYGFQIEMARNAFLYTDKIIEVPIVFKDRIYGESKMSMRIIVEALYRVTKTGLATRILRK